MNQQYPQKKARRSRRLTALLACAAIFATAASSSAAPRLRRLVFNPGSIAIAPGEVVPMRVLGVYDDGSEQELTTEIAFESRNLSVVKVVGTAAQGVATGSTTIRARHPPTGVNAEFPLQVQVVGITALAVAQAETILAPGQTAQLQAIATLTDGRTNVDVTAGVLWESTRREVATVDASSGVVTAIKVGDTEMKVSEKTGIRSPKGSSFVRVRTGGGGSPTPTPTPPGGGGTPTPTPTLAPSGSITAIEASPTKASLLKGETVQVVVVARYQNGAVVDVTEDCAFESSRPAAATVDASGLVDAVGSGQVTIRVTHTPSNKRAKQDPQVSVGKLEEISLALSATRVQVGATIEARALGLYDNDRSRELTEDLTWSSTNTKVLNVSDSPGTRGITTALASGRASVTARDRETGVQSNKTAGEIEVIGELPGGDVPFDPRQIEALSIEPISMRLLPSDSQILQVYALLRDGSIVEVTHLVNLVVKDPRVAVIEGASLQALAPGSTEITAEEPTTRKRSRTAARLHVPKMVALAIEPAKISLPIGQSTNLRALARFDDGTQDVDVTSLVTWTSSNTSFLTVDNAEQKGLVFGVAKGTVEVRAEDPITLRRSDRSTGRVAVGGAVPSPSTEILGLRFDPPDMTLTPGQKRTYVVRGVLADGTEVDVLEGDLKSRSVDRRVATLGKNNEVTGRRGGFGQIEVEHRRSSALGVLPIIVRDVVRIELEPAQITLRPGEIGQFRAWATFNDGSPRVDVTDAVSWRSLDGGVTSVDASVPGRVRGNRQGVARVEAQHRSSRVRSDDSTGRVRVIGTITRLIVDPPRTTIAPGAEAVFRALGILADGSIVDLSTNVQWSTIDPRFGTVDQTGRVRALLVGEFRVRVVDPLTGIASSSFASGTTGDDAIVAVRNTGLLSLFVSKEKNAFPVEPVEIRIDAGESQALFALGRGAVNPEPQNMTGRVQWLSSDPKIATVSRGLVACVAQGVATISVRDAATGIDSNNNSGNARVVCIGEVLALRIDPATVNVDYPKSRQMRAYRVYRDGHEVDVTRRVLWKSSHPRGVSIVETGDKGGMATALDDVIATISAVDPLFGVTSGDRGGNNAKFGVRKTRRLLEIFPLTHFPDATGVYRVRVGELLGFKARVTYKSGVTQGVNVVVSWASSDNNIIEMGANGLQVNQGMPVAPGTVTITAFWPGDDISPSIDTQVTVQVIP